ncbi:MAG: Asp-tRNA(Asn)/Glu-tRNA(Gln) amidotransferase GatCAB subunit C [Acidobacteria bacterium]|nr:MAG: Asp-tRNA(Asn)/Glu-tRNA(Gln) amidotransferase GatCAB subunit C [Acidobacteriota bacterium]
MKIGHAEVEYVAKLANLAITEEEKRRFIDQLNSILEYVEQLNSLNTDNVEPTAQVVYASEQDLGMRQDEPRVTFSQEESLSNGPATGAGYFKVPKVIEER